RSGHLEVLQDDVGRGGVFVRSLRDAHLTAAAHPTLEGRDPHVVAVLEQDRVVPGTGEVHALDLEPAAVGDAEDPAPPTSCNDLTDTNAVRRPLVADPSGPVGDAEGGVAGASAGVVRLHALDRGVDGVVQEQARVSGVASDHPAHREAVHTIGLDPLIARALDVHVVDTDVPHLVVPIGAVIVDADPQTRVQPELDAAEMEVADVAEEHPIERHAGDRPVGILDVGPPARIDGSSVPAPARVRHVDGPAHVQHRVARDIDARVVGNGARAFDEHALFFRAPGSETVDRRLHGRGHAAAAVYGVAPALGGPGAAGAPDDRFV